MKQSVWKAQLLAQYSQQTTITASGGTTAFSISGITPYFTNVSDMAVVSDDNTGINHSITSLTCGASGSVAFTLNYDTSLVAGNYNVNFWTVGQG
jgi:hypothetical protein